jgi:hypothetical protein
MARVAEWGASLPGFARRFHTLKFVKISRASAADGGLVLGNSPLRRHWDGQESQLRASATLRKLRRNHPERLWHFRVRVERD